MEVFRLCLFYLFFFQLTGSFRANHLLCIALSWCPSSSRRRNLRSARILSRFSQLLSVTAVCCLGLSVQSDRLVVHVCSAQISSRFPQSPPVTAVCCLELSLQSTPFVVHFVHPFFTRPQLSIFGQFIRGGSARNFDRRLCLRRHNLQASVPVLETVQKNGHPGRFLAFVSYHHSAIHVVPSFAHSPVSLGLRFSLSSPPRLLRATDLLCKLWKIICCIAAVSSPAIKCKEEWN